MDFVETNENKRKNEDLVKTINSEVSFEEALDYTGMGKYNYILFATSVTASLFGVCEIFGISLVIAASQCDLSLDTRIKGLVGSAPMIGILTSAIFWGLLADRYGRKFTLIITMVGTSIASIISGFATNWIFLAVCKIFSSACASGIFTISVTILGESVPTQYRSKLLLLISTTMMTGQGFIAIVGYPILLSSFSIELPFLNIYYKPWRLFSQSFGFLTCFNLIILCVLAKESPKYFFANGKHDKGLEVLKHIYKTNTGKSECSLPSCNQELENVKLASLSGPVLFQASNTIRIKRVFFEEDIRLNDSNQNIVMSIIKQIIPLLYKENIKNFLLVCYICIMVYSVGPAVGIWIPMITEKYNKAWNTTKNFCELMETPTYSTISGTDIETPLCDDSVSQFTLIVMIILALYNTMVSLLVVFLVKYIGKKSVFTCLHLICGGLGVTLNTFYNIGGIFVFFLEITTIACAGIVTTYAVELFPTYLRAMAVCTTMMIGRMVSFFMINIMGMFLQEGCYTFMYAFALFIMSGASAALLLPPST